MNLNKVFIAGRLTADPQLRTTPSGQSVTSFSLATNRNWTDRAGAKQESVEFHNIVVWGKQAEIANQFLTKGSLVLVEGRLQTRSWNDKQGQARKTTEIVCERLQFGPRGSGGGGQKPQAYSAGRNPQEENQPSIDSPLQEEIPVIDIDTEKEDIKPEDLPF
ncbi:MAG: single-stranded DNA-binding protein [Patescibacteria group bacterium]